MSLKRYYFDGSALSPTDRGELIKLLNGWAYTGCQFINIKNALYEGDFDENDNISELPFPDGTIITPIP